MKKTVCVFALIVVLTGIPAYAGEVVAPAETQFLTFPVSLAYYSTYWWRGTEYNGKGAGLFWPQLGVKLGESGISAWVAGGVNADYFAASESGDKKYAKTLHEFDSAVAYSGEIGSRVSIGLGATYIRYFFYDAIPDLDDGSFIEGSFSLGILMPLNPKIEVYYDYILEKSAAGTPRDEDYYVSFSLSHDLVSTDDGFKVTISSWVGYYNNAYLDRKGLSDAGLTFATAKDYKGTSFTANVNYARSLKSDFQLPADINGDGITGKLKNHFWAEFGVSRTLQ